MKKEKTWKIGAIVIAVVAYIVLLVNISFAQSDYNVIVSTDKEVYEFAENAGECYAIPVKIKNDSNRLLSSITGQDVFLTYHLYDANGNLLVYENQRSSFEKGIFAKEKGEAEVQISPLQSGEYIVGIDIVQENVAWFSLNGYSETKIRIIVK